jgi:hypothetical protein
LTPQPGPQTPRPERGTRRSTHRRIAARTGDDIQHFYNDTIGIHLTKAEMSAFLAARKSAGVVVFISDGSRLSVAKFPRM